MDVYSNNRTKLNTDRVLRVDDKIVVYVIDSPTIGEWTDEIESPGDGKVLSVKATCNKPGSSDTLIDVELCDRDLYDSNPIWDKVFSEPLTIGQDKKRSNSSPTVDSGVIKEGDVFRLNFVNVGEGLQNLTVQIKIQINIEG